MSVPNNNAPNHAPDNTGEDAARAAAEQVVRRLRSAGFQALFAGGCVRDQLLGMIEDEARRQPDLSRMQARLREMADAIAAEALEKARREHSEVAAAPAPAPESAVGSDRLNLLERRISKLTNLLEETEGRLQLAHRGGRDG